MATPPETRPGKAAWSLGIPRTLQEVALIPKHLKGLTQEELSSPCTGAYLLCAFISGDELHLGAWTFFSIDIWGNDAQGCLFRVTEELFHVRGGLSGGLGVTGATLQTAGLAPTGTLTRWLREILWWL